MLGGKGKVETEGGRLRGKEELRKGHGREVEGEGRESMEGWQIKSEEKGNIPLHIHNS